MKGTKFNSRRATALAVIAFWAFPLGAQTDARRTPQALLASARQVIEAIITDDLQPRRGFYLREPIFPTPKDQPILDCASYMFVRGIETKEPYFESKDQRVVVVPVWAELLMVNATNDGGTKVRANGSTPSQCAFEYERWSFALQRFEAVKGFREQTHYEQFPAWGESVINSQISRWIAVDIDKRYVRFLARVNVSQSKPYQLAPQFPRHFAARHARNVLAKSNARTERLLLEGKSDQGEQVTGAALVDDLNWMRLQLTNKSWVVRKLTQALAQLENTKPFEEIKP